jgi:NAD+ diphosphatase
MRIAETVTFGGSGLDRHGGLRRDAKGMEEALAKGRVLLFWHGKPLIRNDKPAWLPSGHPVVAGASPGVFLGIDDGLAHFAADISNWVPDPAIEQRQAGFLDLSIQKHPGLDSDTGFVELRGIMTQLAPREAELMATGKAVLQWHRSHGFCATCGAASDVTDAGWQRSCPACGTVHFPRTDPVVIMLVTSGNSVLLGRSPGWPEGMFSLLAGFVEPGETVEAAVRREVFEEAGVTCGAVSYLASQPWPFPASLMIGMRTEAQGREIRLDPDELDQALWLSREDLVAVFAGRHPAINAPRKGAIAHFILRNWLADCLD